ncbi:Six-hairpin glycosidase-like protein [Niveomyces insectorum RCEF 264]|uniref:Six-hairpin glycosidase-like protein n=1 Tax=Niveomyces insectorum RCEF 264 TaxID=1081102 RepID=A0A167Z6Q0_9HYPO|nr:Six-hairpin glycosidase-like protein [Niveomyces insectorum RCEF 264]
MHYLGLLYVSGAALTPLLFGSGSSVLVEAKAGIPRRKIVQSFNVRRNASSKTTPLQVGNGNLAFGADITGLQTFEPFSILSTWGWHNFSLPTTANQTSPADFTGLDWSTHGRLVNYDQPNPAEADISQWLIQNPQRINLARIGLDFGNGTVVTESQLTNATQELDLWTGSIRSSFVYNGSQIDVETWMHPEQDMLGVSVTSDLLASSDLGLFIEFPYPDRRKFDAPFVGVQAGNQTRNGTRSPDGDIVEPYFDPYFGTIQRTFTNRDGNGSTYYVQTQWDNFGRFTTVPAPDSSNVRYVLHTPNATDILLVASFATAGDVVPVTFGALTNEASDWWEDYWTSGAFVDLTAATAAAAANASDAREIQRRTILSQYLTVVNSASTNPPQESGLVNNGWYGKFHMEMAFWHLVHFARWNHFDLLGRSVPDVYTRFLPSSYDRAKKQGYQGARWGKMTDATGRSAPGEINSLLIWQQPHPLYFAEIHYRAFPNTSTLRAWDEIVTATADFMASFAFLNQTTGVYDLGPPLYPVSETGNPNATINPTFELAYWRFGLDVAVQWKQRQNRTVPAAWTAVRDKLAPLPVANGTFTVYEGVPDMWTDKATTTDHPALAGVYGWLPPPRSGPTLNLTVVRNTADKIRQVWDLKNVFGWDFPLLAMNALRLGDVHQAIAYLLDPAFAFDDAGYPTGGTRVPTPYMPSSGGFLLAVAMLAGGWDGSPGPHFPAEWNATVEGFVPGL